MNEQTTLTQAQNVQVGQLLDLQGDPYADPPNGHDFSAALEHEYAVVESVERETRECVRIDTNADSYGFPVDHEVPVVGYAHHYPELPAGWQWAGGEGGPGYYMHLFETTYQMGGPLAGVHGMGGYSGRVDVSGDGTHHVMIEPVTAIRGDGDSRYGYPVISRSYDTAQEAHDAVPKLIRSLSENETV